MRYLLLFLFCLVLQYSNAQIRPSNNFDIEIFDLLHHDQRGTDLADVVFYDDHYYLLISRTIRGPGGWEHFIEKYDQNFKLIKATDVTSQFISKSSKRLSSTSRPFNFLQIGDKIGLLNQSYSDDDKYLDYNFYELEPTTLKLGTKQALYKQAVVEGTFSRYLSYSVSEEGEFLMIYGVSSSGYGESLTESLEFSVYDSDLNKLYTERDIDLTGRRLVLFTFNQDASVTLVTIDQSKWNDPEEDKELHITDYFDGESTVGAIDLTEEKPYDISIYKKDDFSYGLAGYSYEEDGAYKIFHTEYNGESGKKGKTVSETFTKEFLADTKIAGDETSTTVTSYPNLSGVIKHDDGSISILGSRRAFYLGGYRELNSYVSTFKDGQFQDHVTLEKTIIGSYYSFINQRTVKINDYVAIIYMDNRQNLISIDKRSGPKKCEGKNNTKALTISVFHSGDVSRELLLDFGPKERKHWSAPNFYNDIYVLDNDHIIIWNYKGKKQFSICRIKPDF